MAPSSPTRARARDRYVSPERIIFIVVLSCSLLLLSVAMLRSEEPSSTRTFRDGFIVANRESATRRTVEAAAVSEGSPSSNSTRGVAEPSASPAATAASADSAPSTTRGKTTTELLVDRGEHTTLIKTEDGDEITIKRGANSKKKITKISTHEDGKITIENKEQPADDEGHERADGDAEKEQEQKQIRIEQ
ncbi:hypothetical protein P43SY_006249 [Pythium insidiosum]|uniref:Uncharacterized protein n=1 Tax=Pythium insidiosum TaxID=114742 RepID=A0AAD5LG61_PYTIN|nr:hypothetical protein P43SY_006249 [Pythium insidiosum]